MIKVHTESSAFKKKTSSIWGLWKLIIFFRRWYFDWARRLSYGTNSTKREVSFKNSFQNVKVAYECIHQSDLLEQFDFNFSIICTSNYESNAH